ncbi:hypothetical protein [Pseudomonas sp. EpS/L25]|uniref:hypothetical protein n=1 Tax=Pseudomonas sp. EpS/L25 TaxID=1749078 RepID=UPI000744044F|nr:hypothetical protein [Pseudomonas sp. EpS/L25]KUM42868.1 hypothetical protein AR540_03585 [Pseudomonas sp. EpS/L25]
MPSRLALPALLLSACCLAVPPAHAQKASPPATATASQPLLSSSINDFTNEDWNRGVLRRVAGVTIPATPANVEGFISGRQAQLGDGQWRAITDVQRVGNNLAVFVEGEPLDAETVGYPRRLAVDDAPGTGRHLQRLPGRFNTPINDFTNQDWLKGIYRKAAGVSIPVTERNREEFKSGAIVRLADGQDYAITYVNEFGRSMAVFLDSPALPGEKYGYPRQLTFVAPAPKP